MAEKPARRVRIDPSDLVLEIVSIVIAILLALGVNEWRDTARTRARTHDSLVGIRSEITANRTLLMKAMPHHLAVWTAFRALQSRKAHRLTFEEYTDLFGKTNPNGFRPFLGEETAWRLATTSAALADVEYATRIALERTYQEQTVLDRFSERIADDLHFGPANADANFYMSAISFSLDSADIVYAERDLLRHYDRSLNLLADIH
jgi:hypothetical protein